MSTITINPGQLGADYVSTRNKTKALFDQYKVDFVYRYLKPFPSAYALTITERDYLFSIGTAIGLVWEQNEQSIQKGYNGGVADGQNAAAGAYALGYPSVCAILAAVDTDVYYANVAICKLYLRGFYDGLAGRYVFGLYGDQDAYQTCADICEVWCQANAWKTAAIQQGNYPYGMTMLQGHSNAGLGWDYPNLCVQPLVLWNGMGADPITPPLPVQVPQPAPAPAPTPAPTPHAKDTDIMIGIVAKKDEYDAEFVGYYVPKPDGGATFLSLYWVNDAKKVAAAAAHSANGAVTFPYPQEWLANCWIDVTPTGDRIPWEGKFANN